MANVRRIYQKSVEVARDIFRNSHLPFIINCNNYNDIFKSQSRGHESRQNSAIFKQQLENSFASCDSTVLCPYKTIYRPSQQTAGGIREAIKNPDTARENTEKRRWGIRVPTQTLPANTHIYFTYNLRARDWIYYDIESEFPVDGYIVDESGLNIFKQGLTFMDYGGFKNQTSYRNRIKVPSSGNWYFIIDNPNNQNTAIHYQVN